MRLDDLWRAAEELEPKLGAMRRDVDFPWYPYQSLSNITHLKRLLGPEHEPVLEAARNNGVVDVGCGDGDLSFLFERLGCAVTSFDHACTNHNGMRGVRTLRERLGSSIDLREADLDGGLSLDRSYGLALFLGTLYHLKNPFPVLEDLAKRSRYCLLSTRIAEYYPDGAPFGEGRPISYLLGETELNDDDSNFWIFSPAGLRVLLARTRWRELAWINSGDALADPVAANRDGRAFLLLGSVYGEIGLKLLDGWYPPEETGWRWTSGRFLARAESLTGKSRLRMSVFVPEAAVAAGPIEMRVDVNGLATSRIAWSRSGRYRVVSPIAREGPAELTFSLSRTFRPDNGEQRELGIVVDSIRLT